MAKIINFGCRLNSYESEIMKQNATKASLGDEFVIFNSCAVTNKAEDDFIKELLKTKKENPEKKIIITGCAVQANPQKYSDLGLGDFIIGNKEKTDLDVYKQIKNGGLQVLVSDANSHQRHEDKLFFEQNKKPQNSNTLLVSNIMNVKQEESGVIMSPHFEGRTRAFVQIQNGCNHRCTFCIIPYGRGNSRSVPAGDIISEIKSILASGFKEVVLTGVDITDYGKDLPGSPSLIILIKRILTAIPELPLLRLSSVDVAELDLEIFNLMKQQPRLMPYLHLSLQSGDDMILKRMKRRHLRKDILEFCKEGMKMLPDIMFGCDIIAGFPTEDEQAFENSLSIIEEANISFCHIFPFSPKNGTPAAKMPQIERRTIKSRAKLLIAKGQAILEKNLNKMIGTRQDVLCEKSIARCKNFTPIQLSCDYKQNDFINVTITGYNKDKLILLGQ